MIRKRLTRLTRTVASRVSTEVQKSPMGRAAVRMADEAVDRAAQQLQRGAERLGAGALARKAVKRIRPSASEQAGTSPSVRKGKASLWPEEGARGGGRRQGGGPQGAERVSSRGAGETRGIPAKPAQDRRSEPKHQRAERGSSRDGDDARPRRSGPEHSAAERSESGPGAGRERRPRGEAERDLPAGASEARGRGGGDQRAAGAAPRMPGERGERKQVNARGVPKLRERRRPEGTRKVQPPTAARTLRLGPPSGRPKVKVKRGQKHRR